MPLILTANKRQYIINGNITIQQVMPPAGGVIGYDALSGFSGIYSTRRTLTAYTGDLVRLRRDSDDAESDFGYDANGDLDVAAISTWLGANNAYLRTWYDQSGNAKDATQTTSANQPLYVASGQNGYPEFSFDGVNDSLSVATTMLDSNTFSFVAAMETAATGFRLPIAGQSGGGVSGRLYGGFNGITNLYMRAGKDGSDSGDIETYAPTSGVPFVLSVTAGGGTLNSRVDGGAEETGSFVNDAGWTNFNLGAYSGTSNFYSGPLYELIFFDSALSSGDRGTAETVYNDYWGITTPITDPTDIAGLVGWWDANDITTLWQDSGRTTQVSADAQTIGAWDDKSGGGYHFTQTTAAKEPTYKTGIQNSLPIVRLDGIDDWMQANRPVTAQPWTIVFVAKRGGDSQYFFDGDTVSNRMVVGDSGGGGVGYLRRKRLG